MTDEVTGLTGYFTIDYFKQSAEGKDKCFSAFVCVYLLLDAVNSMIQDVFRLSGMTLRAVQAVIVLTLLYFLFRCATYFNRKNWAVLILFESVAGLSYAYSYFLGVSLSRLLGWAGTTLGVCVPIAVFIGFIENKEIFYNLLKHFSWVNLAVLVIDMVGTTDDLYNIHFSYAVLTVMIIHFNELVDGNKRLLHLIFVIIEFGMIFMYGSRGALVCFGAFIMLKIFFNVRDKKISVKYAILLCVAACGILAILSFGNEIYNLLKSMGITSRTLKLFLTGQFVSHDSGRGDLYSTVRMLIMQKPISGWGIRGAVSAMDNHPYPHQFFYDLVLTFGFPIGICMIIALCLPLLKVFTVKEKVSRDLIQMFFCIGFVALMYSNTLFTDYYYFMFLGLAASCFDAPKFSFLREKI